MTTEEELRKEFVEELRKGITFAGQIGDYVINQSLFDWLNSKLEAKDKEIQELKIQLSNYAYWVDMVKRERDNAENSNQSLAKQITDLKAEIERLKVDNKWSNTINGNLTK